MYPIIARIGPVTIYSFGLLMAVAFLVSGAIVTRELGRKGLEASLGSSLVLWAAIGGLIGARLWVIADDFAAFLEAPLGFVLSGAGFVWYGGLAGGVVGMSAFIRKHRLPWLVTADCVAASVPLGHAIGRIGCQLAGDGDWGTETTLPWAMAYPNAIIGWDYPPGVRVHPTPLYEAAVYAAIFALLWSVRRRLRPAGAMLASYLVLAGVARFLIEFLRTEPRLVGGLTAAQLFSIGIVGAGLVLLARGRAAPAV
jgi:phosphatidylglycerol:prolipoprotein diacylglycerol transferase